MRRANQPPVERAYKGGEPVEREIPSEIQIDSDAFRQVHLKSERFRILAVIAAVIATIVFRGIRILVLHAHEDRAHLVAILAFVALFVLYEMAMLRAIRLALQAGHDLPHFVWIADIVIETSLPALGIAFLTGAVIAPTYRALANPLVLTFFLFIILSLLRLNPWASVLSGWTAAIFYLGAAYYVGWRPMLSTHASIQSPERTVFSFALEFLVAGVVAGAVAREVSRYVDAALREAETRRQMERLEHDMKVARSIQQSLLPSNTPPVKGFDVAGWNLPADETGGDFYDWQMLPDGKLVVTLADVTGHGLGPAMLAAVCRAYARANLSIQDGLLTAMKRINTALSQDLTPGRFATLVAAICTPDSSRVELLSAGQGPLFAYLLREDRVESMGAQGVPLGIMPVLASDPPRFLDLNVGDLLVLATDGLYEWENTQGEQFGSRRLEEVIRRVRGSSPRDIIEALYKAVVEFSGGTKQQDDLTAVIIKRT
jgi:serine phosphatase RsbU (regulator of sigma subunit)